MAAISTDIPLGLCQCGCGGKTKIATRTSNRFGIVKGRPLRYVQGHGRRKSPVDWIEEDRGYTTPCWIWQLKTVSRGYGGCVRDGASNAYRSTYERFVGPIPEGLQLDHLCRVRLCVNPEHLEPVTQAENMRRAAPYRYKTHCKRGHELTPENCYVYETHRECKLCSQERTRAKADRLTDGMRDLLWTVAQHKYGWTYVRRFGGQMQIADGLVRRGLVEWDHNGRDYHSPAIVATEAGKAEIGRRWPVSPFWLGTYEHQPGGWTPVEGLSFERRYRP